MITWKYTCTNCKGRCCDLQDIDGMIDFFLYEKGESIMINGAEQVALVINAVDKLTYYDDKLIRCKCQIKTGDIMEYRGSKYIIISQIDANEKTYKARIRKCSYRIAFNWSGNIKWFDCLEESKVFDITTGTYISYASGNIYVTVQNNSDTRTIALDQRFFVTNQPFKVTGIDKSQEGLITQVWRHIFPTCVFAKVWSTTVIICSN